MTLAEYCNSKIPDYYDGMYLDGYEPWQILHAAHKKMRKAYYARQEVAKAAGEEINVDDLFNIKIISEVKIK